MIVAEQPAAHGQHFSRRTFGFFALAPITQDDAKVTKGIRHLQMLVSQELAPDGQTLPGQRLRFGEFFLAPIYRAQAIERRGHVRVFVSEKSSPNDQGLLVSGLGFSQLALFPKCQAQLVE